MARFQRFGPAKALAGLVTTAGLLVPTELIWRRLRRRRSTRLPRFFHKGLTRSLGIRVRLHGRPVRGQAVLFVSNHIGWADIPVLGGIVDAAFVAKSEVEGFALVGWLATLAGTVYVERDRRATSDEQRSAIAERLDAGESVILFPEGTTSDGVQLLPFKSALFAAVTGDATIQPVTIAYTKLNGLPITRERLPDIAWIGDTELWPHAVAFTALGRVRAELIFHPPVRVADFAGRKELARHCHDVIAAGYEQLMRGGTGVAEPAPVEARA